MIDLHMKFKHKTILSLLVIFAILPIGFLTYKYYFINIEIKKNTLKMNKTTFIAVKESSILPCKIFKLSGARDIKLTQNGTVAIVASSSDGIDILDIKDPLNPSKLSNFKINKKGYDSTHMIILSKDENTLYAKNNTGVFSVDITDLRNPKLLSYLEINNFKGSDNRISISDDYKKLYITGMHGIFIADISQKEEIEIIGKFYDGAYHGATEIDENTLYIVDRYGIDILDISDMNKLKVVGNYPTMAVPSKITLSKNKKRAYISSGTSEIEILNIKNKLNPKPFGAFITNGKAIDIVMQNNGFLYAYNSKYNLEIFDISYAYDPKLIQTIQYEHKTKYINSYALTADKKYLYVAGGSSGLGIVKMPKLN